MKFRGLKFIFVIFIVFITVLQTGCNLFNKEDDEEASNLPIETSSMFLEGTITEEATVLNTEHFKIELPENVYVPGYFVEYLEIIYDALETVSGLSFYNEQYNPDKIIIIVDKNNDTENEFSQSYAYTMGSIIHVSSGDLLLGHSSTLIHELSHILQYSRSVWIYSDVLSEGFAQYNAYKTIKYLESNNISVAKANTLKEALIGNVTLSGDIYSKSIEYWIENADETYNISSNGMYSVGMRFISYLDDIYKNYSKWFIEYEEKNSSSMAIFFSRDLSIEQQLNALKDSYGSNVLDNFYSWLRVYEEAYFVNPWENEVDYNLTELDKTYIFPYFYDDEISVNMSKFYKFSYNDLYINISETRNYLQNYKGKNVNSLTLKLSERVKVELYDANNEIILTKTSDEFSLSKVSYIKLVGHGTLGEKGKHGLKITY